jgi:ABC-2 type transport system ATP-binding protein
VLIDAGQVVAEGTPVQLKARLGAERVEAVVRHAGDLAKAAELLQAVEVDADRRRVSAPAAGGVTALIQAAQAFQACGIEVEDIGVRRPTLDEVFLSVTGKDKK